MQHLAKALLLRATKVSFLQLPGVPIRTDTTPIIILKREIKLECPATVLVPLMILMYWVIIRNLKIIKARINASGIANRGTFWYFRQTEIFQM